MSSSLRLEVEWSLLEFGSWLFLCSIQTLPDRFNSSIRSRAATITQFSRQQYSCTPQRSGNQLCCLNSAVRTALLSRDPPLAAKLSPVSKGNSPGSVGRIRSIKLNFSKLNYALIKSLRAEISRYQIPWYGRTNAMYSKNYPKIEILVHKNNMRKSLVYYNEI